MAKLKEAASILFIAVMLPVLVAMNAILFIEMLKQGDDLDRWY